jgi:hypothetical protein
MTMDGGGAGMVGIGTVSPHRELHIADGVIRVDRDAENAGVNLHVFPPGDFTTPWKGFHVGVHGDGPDDGYFLIGDYGQDLTGATTERLVIDNTGNVGIGTSSPAARLDVAGTAEVDSFKMPTGASDGYILTSDGAGAGTWQPMHLIDSRSYGADVTIESTATQYGPALAVLTVPTWGRIVVTTNVRVSLSHAAGTGDYLIVSVSENPGDMGPSSDWVVQEIPSAYPSSSAVKSFSFHTVHSVLSAGTYAFYLVGFMYDGQDVSDKFRGARMTAVFYPRPM